MMLNTLTFTLAALFTLGSQAQSVADVPQCAQKAAVSSISNTGCQLTDIGCICKNQSFIASFSSAIKAACSEEDQQKTLQFAQQFCASASVSVSVPGGAMATSTGSTPSSTGAASDAQSSMTAMTAMTATASGSGSTPSPTPAQSSPNGADTAGSSPSPTAAGSNDGVVSFGGISKLVALGGLAMGLVGI